MVDEAFGLGALVLGVLVSVVVGFGINRGCNHSEDYRAGSIAIRVYQKEGSFFDCNHPNRYKLTVRNDGKDKATVKVLVGKKELVFDAAPDISYNTEVSPPSLPVIKQLTICKKGNCVRLK